MTYLLFKTSVPNTWMQMNARSLVNGQAVLMRLRCHCGSPVRAECVRCYRCDFNKYQELINEHVSKGKNWVMKEWKKTMPCECGKRRAPEAEACPSCMWQDGLKVDQRYIEAIDLNGEQTATSLARLLQEDVAVVRYDLNRLLRLRRLKTREEPHGGNVAVWYSLP